MSFDHKQIEKKWQKYWDENKTFKTDTYDDSKPKYYCLDMFPYPSGNGLHVGHPEGYTATDIVARAKRMQGFNVLHPMGFDSFGLPAEQFALQTGNHPATFTKSNIEVFKKQIEALGFSYDWDREIATSDPSYYKWTQWIFTKLYDQGLAYVDEIAVNWCPELKAVLANEEVINGRSERGDHPVVRKPMRQWVLKITEYAERLLEDLDTLDWPEATKQMQRHWIGKSVGANVDFKVEGTNHVFTVFTTRCDTLFGATYCVLAPEHPFVDKITTVDCKDSVEAYKKQIESKSDLERTELSKEKTGVFTGAYAINPVNGQKMPIWIADYVLVSYGTGAIMAVPGHDERDFEFANTFNLEVKYVLDGYTQGEAYTSDGNHINSDFLDGMNKDDAITKMLTWLADNGCGEAKTTYKLRDWLFSRQRYWGEPIPIVHMEDGSIKTVPLEQLPLELPETSNFQPHSSGQSPLANCEDWLKVEIDGQVGYRETNTMPQWAGSCWYYIRYIDPTNTEAICDPELINKWLPVDLYIGGAEHAVLHLLYSRFWHKVLYDCGVVETKEPWQRLFHQGMILGDNNEKMSKSRGNVVNPDDIIETHGADTLRLYEMFMGPLEAALPWSANGLDGSRRFLERVYRLLMEQDKLSDTNDKELDLVYHQTVKKVTSDFEVLGFNTAISQMMIFINACYKVETIYKPYAEGFIKMLACIAPHIGEEIYKHITGEDTVSYAVWPTYDEAMLVTDEVSLAVQVNGKLRGTILVSDGTSNEDIEKAAFEIDNVKTHIDGQEVVKVIVVKGKIVNIVVK